MLQQQSVDFQPVRRVPIRYVSSYLAVFRVSHVMLIFQIIINIKKFLQNYKSGLFNQQKIKVKEHFIQFIEFSQQYDFIENNSKIISKRFVIYEKISI